MPGIAVICKTLLRGGAEKQALILTKLLHDDGKRVCIINWQGKKIDTGNLAYIQDNKLNHHFLSGNFIRKLKDYKAILKREEISVVISFLTFANFISGISKNFSKNIVSIGGIRNERLPFCKMITERFIHNHLNNATVFNNFSAKEKFTKSGFHPDKIFVIQNTIEYDNSSYQPALSNNAEIKIVTVGRFVKQKDWITALYSFRKLIDNNKDKNFRYLIIGYGVLEKKIRMLSTDLGIEDNIEILINPQNIPDILKECDIFLSTSLFEGFSNSIMEAMMAGLPVVATEVGDNRYLVKDGYNGYLVPCQEQEKIVEKLEYLASSKKLREDFGRNSRAIIEYNFSKAKLLESYTQLFSTGN